MSLEVSINLNSLRLVREELDDAINHSATDFEAFLADRQNHGNLASSRDAIAQVGGTFRLLQYPGAALLADEMAALIDVIGDDAVKTTEAMVDAITHGYFVLPRYIEFVSIRQAELPILVLPYVNEMRAARRAELLPERRFYEGEIPSLGLMEPTAGNADIPALVAAAPRLRHMFQTGLLGVIRDPGSSAHFQFMRRSLTRILGLLGNHPNAEIWQLASAVMEAFVADKMEVTLNRKRLFGDIEKMMRAIVSQGEEGLKVAPRDGFKQDLLFILMLTDVSRPEVNAVRQAYSLATLDIKDSDIRAQRESMHGPSLDTIESVINVLKDELRGAKDILEIASQNNGIDADDISALKDVIDRVADTLQVLNLSGPEATLREQLQNIDGWNDSVGRNQFLEVADTVLYVESALSSLDRRELTVDDLNQATQLTRKKIVASSQLAEAEQLVIEEAQSGIALAKRAITSYMDSNFDSAHIANVATTLRTVRGGLKILNYNRAAAVLKSCADFVADHIKNSGGRGDQRHQLLETLADALISLEYYLAELESNRHVNENILEVAEESLAALGFAVEP